MAESGTLIITLLAVGFIGILIGAALHKQFSSEGSKSRKLSEALEQEREKNQQYQARVASHFSETAGLLNNLTQQYRDVHQHLALGAEDLCRDDGGQSLLTGVPIELEIAANNNHVENLSDDNTPQPPLDYAPKGETGNTGVLSEEFGLDKTVADTSQENPKPPIV